MSDEIRNGLKTFEMTVAISGVLDVPMEDWPANVQDKVHAAVEAVSEREQLPFAIVHARYGTDVDLPPFAPGHHYLHVIISEVVAADSRDLSPERLKSEMSDEVKRLLN